MKRKKGYDYYAMFMRMTDYAYDISKELADIIGDFKVEELSNQMAKMHKIEQKADGDVHEMMENLAKEFVPPIEREDIISLVQQLDDVIDTIEDILLRLYMYNVQKIRGEAIQFMEIIVKCCEKMKKMMEEFPSFRKSDEIHKCIVEINHMEEEGDRFYVEAMRNIYTESVDTMDIIIWTQLFQCFEDCCDTCESVAQTVEGVIMKNI